MRNHALTKHLDMEYNTQKKKLLLPEYGRNIQKMVDHIMTIEDQAERTRAAKTVIDVMGNLYPHLRDVPDFRHKLWDHLAIMSGFKLDIDTPYPLPSIDKIKEKPEKIKYSTNRIKYRHYGKSVEKLIDKIKELQEPEQKRALIVLTANHMKKSFLTWNKDSVEDEQIYNDINDYYGGSILLPEGMTLSNPKELLQKKSKPSSNKPAIKNNNNSKNNKRDNNNHMYHKRNFKNNDQQGNNKNQN